MPATTSAAGIPLPATSPTVTAHRAGRSVAGVRGLDRDVIVKVAADLECRQVALPERVSGDLGPIVEASSDNWISRAAAHDARSLKQPVVLDGHAHRHGQGGEQVEVARLESFLAGAPVKLDHAHAAGRRGRARARTGPCGTSRQRSSRA